MNILLKYFQSHSKRLTILTDKEKTTFSSILCGMEMCYVDINEMVRSSVITPMSTR